MRRDAKGHLNKLAAHRPRAFALVSNAGIKSTAQRLRGSDRRLHSRLRGSKVKLKSESPSSVTPAKADITIVDLVQLRLRRGSLASCTGESRMSVNGLRLGFAHVPPVGRGLAVLLRLGSGIRSSA
jgi:hypothetical protein